MENVPCQSQTDPNAANISAYMTSPQAGTAASLIPFPAPIQRAIVSSVVPTAPSRATDIWYEDKSTGTVHVMRAGMHWHLNVTASAVWQLLDGQRSVDAIVGELRNKYPKHDQGEVLNATVEFLLHAHCHGLIELFHEGTSG